MTPLLELGGIHTAYGKSQVLFDLSLEVAESECVCLLGRNGVGKTTTMRTIMGLTPPYRGRVLWRGNDVAGQPPYVLARQGIGFVPEDRRIFAELTVAENLEVAQWSAGRSGPWSLAAVFELFPKLAELSSRPGGVLSGGEQQMLTIARTLMGNPTLLLLDEPSEGLAPVIVSDLLEKVKRLKAAGLTLLLAEQGIEFSLSLADRVYVLEKGAICYCGPAAELRADAVLRNRLLAI